MATKRRAIRGIVPAMITPFDASGELSVGGLRELTDHLILEGVHGLFPCGSTGLWPLLSVDERKKVAEVVVDQTNGRVPVIVHAGALDTRSALLLSKHAENIGADAVACITPFYYGQDKETLLAHFRTVSEGVNLPVFAYNIPRNTGVNLSAEMVATLASAKVISGLKDSSRDLVQLIDIIDVVPKSFTVMNGTENLVLSSLVAGAKGGVLATGNAFPGQFVSLFRAFEEGRAEEAQRIQKSLNRAKRLLDPYGISALYCILSQKGLKVGEPRRPLKPFPEIGRRELIKEISAAIGD
jgi:4-hydroxy-tetrahydrodipicolinate synthase